MKMLDKTEQSDRAPNPNEKPESCYVVDNRARIALRHHARNSHREHAQHGDGLRRFCERCRGSAGLGTLIVDPLHGDARGLEVSPSSLLQNELIQCQIGKRLAQPGVLELSCDQLRQPD
jgi:hypothetical protein